MLKLQTPTPKTIKIFLNRTLPTTSLSITTIKHTCTKIMNASSFLWLRFFFSFPNTKIYYARAFFYNLLQLLRHWSYTTGICKLFLIKLTFFAWRNVLSLYLQPLISVSHFLIIFAFTNFLLCFFSSHHFASIQGRNQTCIEAYIFWFLVCCYFCFVFVKDRIFRLFYFRVENWTLIWKIGIGLDLAKIGWFFGIGFELENLI